MKKVKKILFIVLGCIGLALGAVGAVASFNAWHFPFYCWQPFALPKVLKSCTIGLLIPNYTKRTWNLL